MFSDLKIPFLDPKSRCRASKSRFRTDARYNTGLLDCLGQSDGTHGHDAYESGLATARGFSGVGKSDGCGDFD